MTRAFSVGVLLAAALASILTANLAAAEQATLAPPESFTDIADPTARSAALFTEAGKVLTSPRCVN